MDLISILIGCDLAANTGNDIRVRFVYCLRLFLRVRGRFRWANNRDESIVGIS